MIALDTNILVRYFTEDDANQFDRAAALIEGQLSSPNPGFVSLVTMCELIWVLEDVFAFPTERVARVLRFLLETPQIEVEQDGLVAKALASDHGDIADVVIHLIGQANGCTKTVTFDKKFARLEGVELLQRGND
jgi:predicted nucleic-acid-binding protein